MSIQDLIARVADRLTPTERRLAEAVLAEPTLLAFGTVADLADRADASRPSVVRFAAKLGFEGYADLQRWARDGVARQLATPSQRIGRRPGEHAQVHADIERAVHSTLGHLDPGRLRSLAKPLADARGILVLSGETSRAGAVVLHSGLAMVRDHVRLLDEHDLGRDLSSVAPGDAAVVFDFTRYRRTAVTAARTLADLDVRLIAVTDGPLSPIAALTEHWCALDVPAVGPFDSSLPAVVAAELIVLEVVRQLGPAAADRIHRLERLWRATDAFLDDGA